jgi:hypothetical protein
MCVKSQNTKYKIMRQVSPKFINPHLYVHTQQQLSRTDTCA